MRERFTSHLVLRVQLGEIIQQEHDAEFSAGSAPVSPASDAGSMEQDEEDAIDEESDRHQRDTSM